MCSFPDYDILLLVFYSGQSVGQGPDLAFNRRNNVWNTRSVIVGLCFQQLTIFANIYYAVNVEATQGSVSDRQ